MNIDFFNYYYGIVILCFCFAVSFTAMAKLRYKTVETIALWAMATIVVTSGVITFTYANDITDYLRFSTLAYIYGVTIFSLTSMLVSKESFPEKLFKMFTNISVFIILNTISVAISKSVIPISTVLGQYWVSVSIRTAFYAIYTLIYLKVVKKKMPEIEYRKRNKWWPFVVISIMYLVVFSYLSYILDNGWELTSQKIIVFALATGAFIITYWGVLSSINSLRKSESMALMEQNEKYLKQQLYSMSIAEEEMRKTRHDIRHHNMVIAEFAKNGDTEKILQYIDEYDEKARKNAFVRYCINDVVNAIVSSYVPIFDKDGIKFECECDVPKETAISDTDYVSLVSNILENALHGCKESGVENPVCNFQIKCKNDKLAIQCDNSCKDNIMIDNGILRMRGTGIASMIAVLDKYGGEIKYAKNDNTLTLRAILNYI